MKINKNSKMMLYGQSLSFLGDYCTLPALLILSTYYHNGWVTSGVVIVRSLPLIVQPLIGNIIDQVDKLKIMIVTDIIRFIMFLSILFIPKGEYPFTFLGLLLIAYFSGIFFNPARLATMSTLGEDVKKVNTIFAQYTTLFITIGASLGVVFVIIGNVKYAIILNALTYLLSAFFLSKISIKLAEDDTKSKVLSSDYIAGFKVIFNNRFVFNSVLTMFTMALLWGVIYSNFPVVSNFLRNKEIGNFYLTISIGVGGFIGAYIVNKLGFNTQRGIYIFTITALITIGLFINSLNFIYAFIIASVFFATMEYGEVIAKVNVQEHAHPSMHGRIFSISEAIIGVSMSLGSTLINYTSKFSLLILLSFLLLTLLINSSVLYRKG